MKKFFLAFCVFSFGCAPQLPIEIWIDSDWDDDETETVLQAMDLWKEGTEADIFDYQGRIESEYSDDNYKDNQHVIYKILSSGNEELRDRIGNIMEEHEVNGVEAFAGRDRDIVFLYYTLNRNPEYDDREIFDGQYTLRDQYLNGVQDTIMHEIGHLFGMRHNSEDSIMNTIRANRFPDDPFLRERDVNEFCEIYDC